MPREQNGVLVFGQNEFFEELKDVSFSGIQFPHGIKQVELAGQKTWIPATQDDVVVAETRRTGEAPNTSRSGDDSCRLTGPTSCAGQCWLPFASVDTTLSARSITASVQRTHDGQSAVGRMAQTFSR